MSAEVRRGPSAFRFLMPPGHPLPSEDLLREIVSDIMVEIGVVRREMIECPSRPISYWVDGRPVSYPAGHMVARVNHLTEDRVHGDVHSVDGVVRQDFSILRRGQYNFVLKLLAVPFVFDMPDHLRVGWNWMSWRRRVLGLVNITRAEMMLDRRARPGDQLDQSSGSAIRRMTLEELSEHWHNVGRR